MLALRRFRIAPLLLLAVLGGDLAWQATHQDQPLRWLRASQVAPAPSGSAAFLLARQRSDGPFRIATAAPEPVLVHQLGAHRSPSARALLLDQEAPATRARGRRGVQPRAPQALQPPDARLQRRARRSIATSSSHCARPRRSCARWPCATTSRRRASSPPGLPVVYRDRLSVVTRDPAALPFARIVRPGRAPLAARVVAREPDRIVIAPPGPGRLVVADLVYPGWKVRIDGKPARALAAGDLRAVEVPAGARRVTWVFTPPGVRAGRPDLARRAVRARRRRVRSLVARAPLVSSHPYWPSGQYPFRGASDPAGTFRWFHRGRTVCLCRG